MSIKRANIAKLMGCACIAAFMPAAAIAQGSGNTSSADDEDIVVTGSRIITNGNNSPTPVTVVATEQLQATTPTNIYDALQKLPSFLPSGGQRVAGTGSTNSSGNYLNLRSLGPQRLLLLLDGHRLPPTSSTGAVDTNILPQMLVKRIEIVTGGASAVYGSDAVSGVVNYIIDRDFNGVRVEASKGISQRGDVPTTRAGIAAGTSLFGGRGHIEASFEHFDSGGLDSPKLRKWGPQWCTLGGGTIAQPYQVELPHCANGRSNFGGVFLAGPLNLLGFNGSRQLVPFNAGTPVPPGVINLNGEGAYLDQSMLADLNTDQAFGRFDFDLSDNVHFYAQGGYTDSYNANDYVNVFLTAQRVNHENPFLRATLTPAQRAALDANPTTFSSFFKIEDTAPDFRVVSTTKTALATAGLTGDIGGFRWDVSYSYSQVKQRTSMLNNLDVAKYMAASDVVTNPANGQPVCRVTLTNPGLYPGCEPLDIFGVEGTTPAAWDKVRTRTTYLLTSTMHDVAGSIGGTLLDNWAGPVQVNLSGDYRHNSINTVTNAIPAPINCTGLASTSCGTGLYALNFVLGTAANVAASQEVYEGALEANIPLLRDFVLAKSLDLNLAGRYTHYSTSGSVKTWKAGLDWHVTDDLRFRGTISRDIRAPTLYDLQGPTTIALGTFDDLFHTKINSGTAIQTGANPDLVPEKADTFTVGAVYRPSWLPGFSLAVDYYKIKIDNAIASLSGTNPIVQQLCQLDNGTGPYCSLYVRPLPFSDRTAANYPTRVLSQPVNVANIKTHGVDGEVNYVFDGLGGKFHLRGLVSYQPSFTQVQFSNQPTIEIAGTVGVPGVVSAIPTWRVATFIGYDAGPLSVNVQNRWRSKVRYNKDSRFIYTTDATVPAVSYTDLAFSYTIPHKGFTGEFFVAVENVFDKQAPLYTGQSATTSIGVYPALPADDVIGRHFTAGFRARF